jgi:hypothetical protein
MWKLLSGIAVILVLDIVFIWMMALEPDAPEIAKAIGPTAAVPVIHEQVTSTPQLVDDDVEPTANDQESEPEMRNSRVSKRHTSRSMRRYDRDSTTVSAIAPKNLFQDTIIWIGRTEVPVKIEREPVLSRSEIPKATEVQASVAHEEVPEVKKRSFQSKAIGVIKKPYELIKAFADKFN